MRVAETKVYKFNELSDEAQQKALAYFWDINVDDSLWYKSVYEG